jgi:hypothetical protein
MNNILFYYLFSFFSLFNLLNIFCSISGCLSYLLPEQKILINKLIQNKNLTPIMKRKKGAT